MSNQIDHKCRDCKETIHEFYCRRCDCYYWLGHMPNCLRVKQDQGDLRACNFVNNHRCQ